MFDHFVKLMTTKACSLLLRWRSYRYCRLPRGWPVTPLVLMESTACFLVLAAPFPARTEPLPQDFVFLRDVDPSIIQDMRYAGDNNFVGRPLPGYEVPECVLKRTAANALREVQRELSQTHLSLKMLDCYRPVRAVQKMVQWVHDKDLPGDDRYFPRTRKSDLILQGYIASRSGHSTGNVVDLTLVDLSAAQPDEKIPAPNRACISKVEHASDNSVDMGTSFDCFDPMSATGSGEINAAQRQWRKTLVAVMAHHGFSNYSREWWHFSFEGGGPAFDFSISRKNAPPTNPNGSRLDAKPAGNQPATLSKP